jgi:hypothetical protein
VISKKGGNNYKIKRRSKIFICPGILISYCGREATRNIYTLNWLSIGASYLLNE